MSDINYWTKQSIVLANEHDYLDRLFTVYPMSVNPRRKIDPNTVNILSDLVNNRDFNNINNFESNKILIKTLLKGDIFPIKDSYVAYLRRDNTSIDRNPKTINRIASIIYEMGFDKLMDAITQPKETNRQIGPMFQEWVRRNFLGADYVFSANSIIRNNKTLDQFLNDKDGSYILTGSDADLEIIAQKYLGYSHAKGVDFIAKYNEQYVIGEAKFLTDYGGHQNAQMNDALNFINSSFKPADRRVHVIAILDGVNYILNKGKLYENTTSNPYNNIMSSLVLRDYLFSL